MSLSSERNNDPRVELIESGVFPEAQLRPFNPFQEHRRQIASIIERKYWQAQTTGATPYNGEMMWTHFPTMLQGFKIEETSERSEDGGTASFYLGFAEYPRIRRDFIDLAFVKTTSEIGRLFDDITTSEYLIWQRERIMKSGLPEAIGKTADHYQSEVAIPKSLSRPNSVREEFYSPVLVDPRVPLTKLVKALGLEYTINLDPRYFGNRDKSRIPSVPYIVWMGDPAKYSEYDYETTLDKLTRAERAVTLHEAIYLHFANPTIVLDKFGIEAAGSVCTDGQSVPLIEANPFTGKPQLVVSWRSFSMADQNRGVLTRAQSVQRL